MKKSQLLSVLLLASALTLAGCNSGSDTSSTSSSSSTSTSQPTSSTTAADKEEESIEVNAPAKVNFHGTIDLDQYVSVVYDDGSKDKAFTASIDTSKTTAEVSLAGHILTLGGEGSITVKLASKTLEATFKTTAESALKKQVIDELSELTDYALATVSSEGLNFIAYHNANYEFYRSGLHEFSGTAKFKSGLAYDGVFQEDEETGAYSAPVFESAESSLLPQELRINFDALVPAYQEQAQMEYVALPADAEPLTSWADSNIQEVFYYATMIDIEDVIPTGATFGDLWIVRQENEGIVSYGFAFNYTTSTQEPGQITLVGVSGQMASLANVEAAIQGDDPEESPFPYDEVAEFYGFGLTDLLPEFAGVSAYEAELDKPDFVVYANMKSNVSATTVAGQIQAALDESEDFDLYMALSSTVNQYQAVNDRYLVYVTAIENQLYNIVAFVFAPIPLEPTDTFPMSTMTSVFDRAFTDTMPEVDGKAASLAYTPDDSYLPTFYVDVQFAEEPADETALKALITAYGTKLEESGFTKSGTYYLSEHFEYRVSLGTYGKRMLIAINVLDKTMPEQYISGLIGKAVTDHLPEFEDVKYYLGNTGDGYANIYVYLTSETAEEKAAAYNTNLVTLGFTPYSKLSNGAVLYLSPNAEYQVAVFKSDASTVRMYFLPAPIVSDSFPLDALSDWLKAALEDPSYDFGGSTPVDPFENATYYFEDQGDYAVITIKFASAPEGGIDAAIAAFNAAQVEAGFVQYGTTKWYDSADEAYYFGATAIDETSFSVLYQLN